MLRWFRAKSRSLAVAVFVSLSAMGASSVTSHGAVGHDDHGVRLVVHDASAHAFTSGSSATPESDLHCVLCHLTRAARRPSLQASVLEPAPRSQVMVFRGLGARVASTFPAAEPPLRSPPLSL